MIKKFLASVLIATVAIAGCKKSDPTPVDPIAPPPTDTTSNPIPSPAKETFEAGTKDDYAPASISLATGKWSFDNAVIGNTAEDKKTGSKAARIQHSGKLTMNFDIVNGVYRVVISSAAFGTDGPSAWQLWASYNGGYSYSQMGNSIVTAGNALQNDTIIVNAISKLRLSIRKISGGANRLNIDDVEAILTSGPLAPDYTDDNHMLLGNPTGATGSILDFNNYYANRGYYAMSYNSEAGKANWVSWHLGASDLGSTPRQDDFRPDENIPASWYHVTDQSYSGSGFDRGHSCPSNDRTSSVAANSSTFLMTNIFPQAPNNNQGPWAKLEDSCNVMVRSLGKELYIICGTYGQGGTGNNGFLNEIDASRIIVPAYTWKVVVVLPGGNSDLSRINNSTRVIAVNIPNDNGVGISTSWKSFRVSVDALESMIETSTGRPFNLLSNLPASVQAAVESQADNL